MQSCLFVSVSQQNSADNPPFGEKVACAAVSHAQSEPLGQMVITTRDRTYLTMIQDDRIVSSPNNESDKHFGENDNDACEGQVRGLLRVDEEKRVCRSQHHQEQVIN